MADDARKTTIGESTPVTIGLMIAVVSAACVVAIDHGTIRELDRRQAQTEAKIDSTADRLTKLEINSDYTRKAVDEMKADVKALVVADGVRTAGGKR